MVPATIYDVFDAVALQVEHQDIRILCSAEDQLFAGCRYDTKNRMRMSPFVDKGKGSLGSVLFVQAIRKSKAAVLGVRASFLVFQSNLPRQLVPLGCGDQRS